VSMDVGTETDEPVAESRAGRPPPRDRGRHTARWVGVAVLVIAAGLIAVLATRPSATTVEARSALVGKIAPPVAGPTLDGSRFELARSPGHYVVLNFFASWCVPCQLEGPELVAFQFQHQRSGSASVLSVVFSDTTSGARAYQQQIGVTWPTMADPNGSIALAYGVREDPTSFLIAPDGRVVASISGGVTAKGLNALVAKAEASGYGT
jgi:cytochrome c biogenesis protein CcmG/thiol:disulfide interchange protein DsbE